MDAIFQDYQNMKPASEPTPAAKGSPERVEVYKQRVERGESIWHSGDSPESVPSRENPRFNLIGNPKVFNLEKLLAR